MQVSLLESTDRLLKVLAVDLGDGGMTILRKSCDENNEFLVNFGQGKYELGAQA